MLFREATINDISQIQSVRNSVRENRLSNPALVTDKDCEEYILIRGKGWVCEMDNKIVGFSIADLEENNIWALFIHPDYESKNIGTKLHDMMLTWYFSQTEKSAWLSTTPRTRAEEFYKRKGWKAVGTYGKGETRFEMSFSDWMKLRKV